MREEFRTYGIGDFDDLAIAVTADFGTCDGQGDGVFISLESYRDDNDAPKEAFYMLDIESARKFAEMILKSVEALEEEKEEREYGI